MQEEDIFNDILGDYSEVVFNKQHSHVCPECQARFKWDCQLLRHQKLCGHLNSEREERRRNRTHKKQLKECGYCKENFHSQLDRLSHYPWCEANPNNILAPHKSEWSQYNFQCLKHEEPYYFLTSVALRGHLKTHRKKNSKVVQQQNIHIVMSKRVRIPSAIKEGVRQNLAKLRRLPQAKAEDISMKFGVSVASIRKMFRRVKESPV